MTQQKRKLAKGIFYVALRKYFCQYGKSFIQYGMFFIQYGKIFIGTDCFLYAFVGLTMAYLA